MLLTAEGKRKREKGKRQKELTNPPFCGREKTASEAIFRRHGKKKRKKKKKRPAYGFALG